MQLKTRRTAILIAALVLIVGISVIIYKVSSPQGEDLADPAVANTNQAEEGEPQVEEAAVEYVFQANDPRNTLKGPHTEVADCAPCSDGKQVGGLFEGSSVQFNDVEIPEAGQYIVTVYYISGDPRSFFVQANGTGEAEKYDLPEVGKNDWESVGTYEFAVELAAGKNTLLFSDGDWYSPNLDKIILRKRLRRMNRKIRPQPGAARQRSATKLHPQSMARSGCRSMRRASRLTAAPIRFCITQRLDWPHIHGTAT